jgi:NAD(P)-dependent dehydrogenase (short-subunit alcohol dehydrogenase family)
MNLPEQRVAIVTGAGRGIGREIAAAFARTGACVVLAARTQGQLQESVSAICSEGLSAIGIPTDVTAPEDVQRLVRETITQFGKIDILVNSAGTNYVSNLLLSDDARWKQTIDVNLHGVYLCTKAVMRHMVRNRSGRVINISSEAGKLGVRYNSAYCSAKAAVLGFTRAVAVEVAGLGITVNAICPWHVDTAMMREAMGSRSAILGRSIDDQLGEIVASNPQKRLITSAEVAGLAVFLASPEAAGINGQAINQCGGAVAC